jgi:hypothetical protein
MTWRRFLGNRRQPDQWPDPHERARTRMAEQLDWPLEPAEEAWLGGHLESCSECSAVAADYAAQRLELRALKGRAPEPPRDLWARTAAAIEAESARRGTSGERTPVTDRALRLPLGAISGVLVVAVVVGASLLSQGPLPPPIQSPVASSPGAVATPSPGASPLRIDRADDVAWIQIDASGDANVKSAPIDEVCPDGRTSGCRPIDGSTTRQLKLRQAPVAVVRSPAEGELIVVNRPAGATSDTVYAVPAPSPTGRPSPTPSVGSGPSNTPVPTPEQTPTATIRPTESASPPTSTPSTGSGSASPSESALPTATPIPPVEGAIAIATDVVLVGDTAAYSPDGRWFAFSARPADGSTGPDVYIWQSGQASAVAVTTDHRTVFASWLGEQILASRAIDPSADPESSVTPGSTDPSQPAKASASTSPATSSIPDGMVFDSEVVLIDPNDGTSVSLGGGAWRPTVRPGEDAAVYWDGTLEAGENGVLRTADGRLVLGRWPTDDGSRDPQVIADDAVADWDARWDATGTRLAVWVADGEDPELGTLTLYLVDAESGRFDRGDRPLRDVPARRGFSLAEGRLAWVTPAAEDGAGSRVQVLAWTDDGFGKVETLPGEATIVVIR